MYQFDRFYITPSEAEDATGIDAATIRRAIQNREMRCVHAGRGRGGAIHNRLAEFNRWLAEKEEDATRPIEGGIA